MPINDYTTSDPKKGKILCFPDGSMHWVGKSKHLDYWLFDGEKLTTAEIQFVLMGKLIAGAPYIEP
jgi:hypothetical protein